MVRLLLVFVGIALLAPALAADDRVDRLTEEHKNWLEQEVIYIISEREREAFLDLETRECGQPAPRTRACDARYHLPSDG